MSEQAAERAADTIFALATGAGRAAISVMRLSGSRVETIMRGLCGSVPAPRQAALRSLRDTRGGLLDRALVLWMPGPRSYTGEDTAELHLHGGTAVSRAVSASLIAAGARPADPGEFTRRAFLAGRMDLLEAEAIDELVNSETESQRIQALRNLDGGAGQKVAGWSTRLTQCLAFQEALIDFPDEGLPASTTETLAGEIAALQAEIEAELTRSASGELVRRGLIFAIGGEPNVGKSSLFNAIAGREAAIVSARPGTTRDILELPLELGGVAVTLLDTAGLRDSADEIEAEGVRRARLRLESADLVIRVIEAGTPRPGHTADHELLVASKADLAPASEGMLTVSTRTGEGLDALMRVLADEAARLTRMDDAPVLSQARHAVELRAAASHLAAACICSLAELRGEELRLALACLGRISGRVDTESVLDVVFGAFCIGK
jgi:tRNA modification GTPase